MKSYENKVMWKSVEARAAWRREGDARPKPTAPLGFTIP